MSDLIAEARKLAEDAFSDRAPGAEMLVTTLAFTVCRLADEVERLEREQLRDCELFHDVESQRDSALAAAKVMREALEKYAGISPPGSIFEGYGDIARKALAECERK
jgi:hypothetical protein